MNEEIKEMVDAVYSDDVGKLIGIVDDKFPEQTDIKTAVEYLREAGKEFLKERGKYLHSKDLKNAKKIHDGLAIVYYEVAGKIKEEGTEKESLETFAYYWLRSGETESFIEPTLPGEEREESKVEKYARKY